MLQDRDQTGMNTSKLQKVIKKHARELRIEMTKTSVCKLEMNISEVTSAITIA